MAETVVNLKSDLKEAAEMADHLAEYLRGDALYGSIGGGLFGSGSKPPLTVGALLLRLRRLHGLEAELTPDQQSQLAAADAQHAAVKHEWRMHYDEKRLREAHSRLDAMRAFFEECTQSPKTCAANYLPEALRRTIVQELIATLDDDGLVEDDLKRKQREIDSRLRRYTRGSDFVWAPEFASVYPRDVFWWLYARPQASDQDQ